MAKKPAESSSIFQMLTERLSLVTGKVDNKSKGDDGRARVIRPASPVILAGSDEGPAFRLPGVFSTRAHTVDAAIGCGGIPMSRITTLSGGEGGGKTTMALHLVAECQAKGGIALYIDNEHKLDLDYAASLGVNLNEMLLTQPSTIEDSLLIFNAMIRELHELDPGRPILGILDSINASKSEVEYEEDGNADFSKASGGLAVQARVMSDRLPKIARAISGKPIAFLMISQPRDLIGVSGKNWVAGGNAPRFYSSVIITLRNDAEGKFHKESGVDVGSKVVAQCIKNQVAKPYGKGEFMIRWGEGIDSDMSLVEQACKMGIVARCAQGYFEMESPYDDGTPLNTKGIAMLRWQGPRGFQKLVAPDNKPYIRDWLLDKIREPYNR